MNMRDYLSQQYEESLSDIPRKLIIRKGDYVRFKPRYRKKYIQDNPVPEGWHDVAVLLDAVGIVDDVDGRYIIFVEFCFDGIAVSFIADRSNYDLLNPDDLLGEKPAEEQASQWRELLHEVASRHYNGSVIDGNRERCRAGLLPIGESLWHKERGQDPHIYVRRYMKT